MSQFWGYSKKPENWRELLKELNREAPAKLDGETPTKLDREAPAKLDREAPPNPAHPPKPITTLNDATSSFF